MNGYLQNTVSRYDDLGLFERYDEHGEVSPIRCVRPREIQLTVPPTRVIDSTNASLTWNTQVNPQVTGTPVDLPSPSRWDGLVQGIDFFAHNLNNPLEVRRFATQSKATINFDNGQSTETTLNFIEDPPEKVSGEDAA